METSNEFHESYRRCRPGRRIDVGIRRRHYMRGRNVDLTRTMANLPVTINNFVQSPYAYWKQLAWSAALLITLTVLALNIGARILGAERTPK
jgi:ABC-type phosphate transport system permease subunit